MDAIFPAAHPKRGEGRLFIVAANHNEYEREHERAIEQVILSQAEHSLQRTDRVRHPNRMS